MNLVKSFASLSQKRQWWVAGQKVVVAVSTGVDSMVLLSLLQRLRYNRPQIIVAHVNHHLRDASDKEARFLKHYCQKYSLQFEIADWYHHPDYGMENAGRQFRYRFFAQVMDRYHAKILLTAHHRNDQAETFLMKLIRGGAIQELQGINEQRSFNHGQLIRPLLNFDKSVLKQFAIQHDLTWYEDLTNQQNDVLRNRVRNQLLPMMIQENPQLINELSSDANQIRSLVSINRELLRPILDQMATGIANQWNIAAFSGYSLSLQRALITMMVDHYRPQLGLNQHQLTSIIQLINNHQKPNGYVEMSHNDCLTKNYHLITLKKTTDFNLNDDSQSSFMVRLNRWFLMKNGLRAGIWTSTTKTGHLVKISDDQFPLRVRNWQRDDQIALKGGGHQKVNRILIDQKTPWLQRKQAQVLVDRDDKVLALLGHKVSYDHAPNKTKYWIKW